MVSLTFNLNHLGLWLICMKLTPRVRWRAFGTTRIAAMQKSQTSTDAPHDGSFPVTRLGIQSTHLHCRSPSIIRPNFISVSILRESAVYRAALNIKFRPTERAWPLITTLIVLELQRRILQLGCRNARWRSRPFVPDIHQRQRVNYWRGNTWLLTVVISVHGNRQMSLMI